MHPRHGNFPRLPYPGLLATLVGLGLLAAVGAPGRAWIPAAPAAVKVGRGPLNLNGLQNVVRLSPRLLTGGVPEGDAGFSTLQQLGVKTVITVDGAPPDLARARRYGMRYVHLPFGYDGCPTPTANRLAKAVRDLPGPIYIHCHHGKHRSPAAGAMVRRALDGLTPEEAVREMERAGTGKNYTGLYADVRAYRPPTAAELDRIPADFPESVPPPPTVQTMVEMERRLERLLARRRGDWQPPSPRADAAEALLLRELYTEWLRRPETLRRPADFLQWAREGERDGLALEAQLGANNTAEASRTLSRIAAGCGSCHARYRNQKAGSLTPPVGSPRPRN